jgi:hypothetical protein
MRQTLTLDDDVHAAIKAIAKARGDHDGKSGLSTQVACAADN